LADEVKLHGAQMRDLVSAILAAGVSHAKPNCKPEEAHVFYKRVRQEVEKKGLAPK
jgi:hypothetical protein